MSIDIENEHIDEYIGARIGETAQLLGYDDYKIKSDKEEGTFIGNLGVIKMFHIDGTIDGERRKTHLVAKTITPNKTKRRCVPIETYVEREVHMYSNILKLFDEMQEDCGVQVKFPHPKAYSVSTVKFEEVILLENLRTEGYAFPKNFKSLDYEHSILYLEALGQFHALSFALKHRNPDMFELLVKDMYDMQMSSKVLSYIEHMFKKTYSYGVANVPEVKEYVQVLGKKDAFQTLEQIYAEPGQNGVICHGDPWSTNGLYVYKDNKPEMLMLLDWQCLQHISPVVDLLFLLFTSVEEQLRENSLKDLIEIYYRALQTSLLDLKCDVRELYPRSAFHLDLKKYSPAVVGNCLVMIVLFFLEPSVVGFMEKEPEDVVLDLPPMTDIVHNKYAQMAVDFNGIQKIF